jgi:hypothetical protein
MTETERVQIFIEIGKRCVVVSELASHPDRGKGKWRQLFLLHLPREAARVLRSTLIARCRCEDGLTRAFGAQAIELAYVESIRSEVDSALENAQWLEREMHKNIRSQLRQLGIKEDRLLDLAAEADIATLRLAERLKSIQLERSDLEQKLATTDDHIQQGIQTLHAYLSMLVEPGALFEQANDSARRGLLEAFFSQIWLDAEGDPSVDVRQPAQEVIGAASVLAASYG